MKQIFITQLVIFGEMLIPLFYIQEKGVLLWAANADGMILVGVLEKCLLIEKVVIHSGNSSWGQLSKTESTARVLDKDAIQLHWTVAKVIHVSLIDVLTAFDVVELHLNGKSFQVQKALSAESAAIFSMLLADGEKQKYNSISTINCDTDKCFDKFSNCLQFCLTGPQQRRTSRPQR